MTGRFAAQMVTRCALLAIVWLAWTPALRAEPAAACVEPGKEQITALVEQWQTAIASGTPEQIAAFYAEDAVLRPAMADDVRTGRDAIRAYYTEFTGRHPVPVTLMRAVMVGCGMASEAGDVNYRVTGQRKGTRMLVGGRSTTVFTYHDGRWLISQQSLALVPKAYRIK